MFALHFSVMRRLATALCLAVALGACGQQDPQKPNFRLVDITGADFGKSLALTDHTGKARTLDDFKGKVVAIFFGFTQCPDVCPTMLAEMGKLMKELGRDSEKVQVLFVSVDPERDTPELLKQYVTAFHPAFLGLRGDTEATARATKEFKIYNQKQPLKTGGYSVDHSAGMYILDQQGRLRLYAQYGVNAEMVLADIRELLKQLPADPSSTKIPA
jgi:protein SCO1/2